MIGRQHGHDGVGGALPGDGRAQRDRRAGVTPNRFGHDVFGGKFRQLFAHRRRLGRVGDDEDVLQRRDRQHAIHRLLQKGTSAQQGDQLLGHFLAADRPEPFSASSRHDDDEPLAVLFCFFHNSTWLNLFAQVKLKKFFQKLGPLAFVSEDGQQVKHLVNFPLGF